MLDILAMRKSLGVIGGDYRINGVPIEKKNFKYLSAYVPQEDVFLPTLSVQQTLDYYADLLLGPGVCREAKRQRIR